MPSYHPTFSTCPPPLVPLALLPPSLPIPLLLLVFAATMVLPAGHRSPAVGAFLAAPPAGAALSTAAARRWRPPAATGGPCACPSRRPAGGASHWGHPRVAAMRMARGGHNADAAAAAAAAAAATAAASTTSATPLPITSPAASTAATSPSPVRAMVAAAFAAAALVFGSPRPATAGAAAAAIPRTSRDSNAGGDVGTATATLLAVTGAAVVLRVISARREDPEAEAARVAAECERLAREEASRAIRTQRLEMEILDDEDEDGSEGADGLASGLGGEDLLSALRKRVAGMDDAGAGKDGEDGGVDGETEEEAAARRGEEADRLRLQQQLQSDVDREMRRGREQAQGRPLAGAGVGGGLGMGLEDDGTDAGDKADDGDEGGDADDGGEGGTAADQARRDMLRRGASARPPPLT
ncbi:hypothetical protein I4F81_007562 [Pyropia yezoensis]|uniref:Uncharacterized protein n=1 Tax=Pyropia yezoensis TaxID=2788 RepID=A0ACC3C5K4_PYRYE|nr:hypothetical protein I4F81_007562 [Neopyropia yezoensis]